MTKQFKRKIVPAIAIKFLSIPVEPFMLICCVCNADDASESEVVGFVNEIIVMKSIGHHTNVIGFLGCCSQPGTVTPGLFLGI